LTIVCVLAVVGTALAFKARRLSITYCTRSASLSSGRCQGYVINAKIVSAPLGTEYYGFQTTNHQNCTNLDCGSNKVRLDVD